MSLSFLTFLAQATPAAPVPPESPFSSMFIPIILMGVVCYFIIIRPQQKRQKEQQALISLVKTGDKVITTAGIHGLVSNVKDTTVIVKIADNVKVELEKSAIASVTKRSEIETATVS